jgi:hypothetical protein
LTAVGLDKLITKEFVEWFKIAVRIFLLALCVLHSVTTVLSNQIFFAFV